MRFLDRVLGRYFDLKLQEKRNELEKDLVKFESLHQERGEKIKELYQKLDEFEHKLTLLTKHTQRQGEPTKEELAEEAFQIRNDMMKYLRRNRIFFEKELCEDFDKLFSESYPIIRDFKRKKIHDYDSPIMENEKADKLIEEYQEMVNNGEIDRLQRKIESRFRNLIGV